MVVRMIERLGWAASFGRLALLQGRGGRVRVCSDNRIGFGLEPLTLVLSPCARGEAKIAAPCDLRLKQSFDTLAQR